MLATSVPVVTVRSPVDAPVNEPVPTRNLSADSSQPLKALSAEPRSITIPESLLGVPDTPFPSSINVSLITVFVVFTVVVVPLTVKFPATVTLATLNFYAVVVPDLSIKLPEEFVALPKVAPSALKNISPPAASNTISSAVSNIKSPVSLTI